MPDTTTGDGTIKAVTDQQTWVLKLAGWIRTAVVVVTVLAGMVGYDVVVRPKTPTPPDQSIPQLIEALAKFREPVVVPPQAAPVNPLAGLPPEQVYRWIGEYMEKQKK